MKPVTLLIAAAGLTAGALVISLPDDETFFVSPAASGEEPGGSRFACPMICFIGNKKAPCPVCGMEMTLVEAGALNREQVKRMGLETTKVEEGEAIATVRAYGTVRYDERTARAVVARVSGRIVARHPAALHLGNLVQPGDPLVDLYSPEAYGAQAELAAALRLGDQSARQAVMERFNRWNLAPVAAAIAAGASPTDTITITSPHGGRIIGTGMDALPEVGAEIMADRPLVRLVDPGRFMVVVHVPEARAHWIREGQTVSLASDDLGELPGLRATVSWVAPELSSEIRAREIHLHLEDPEGVLLPGSLVLARMEVALDATMGPADPADSAARGKFLLVPKSAVLSTGTRNVVWKVADRARDGTMRFTLAPVALGPRLESPHGDDRVVVRAGLNAGDEVATQGAFLIDSQAQLAGTASLLFPLGASGGNSQPAGGDSHQH